MTRFGQRNIGKDEMCHLKAEAFEVSMWLAIPLFPLSYRQVPNGCAP